MLTLSLIAQNYLIFILYLLVAYFIGISIRDNSEDQIISNSFSKLFKPLFWGLIAIVVSTALIASKGLTVYSGLLLFFVGLLIVQFKNKGWKAASLFKKNPIDLKSLGFIWLVGTIFFLINLTLYKTGSDTKIPHEDYLFYGKIVSNLFNGYEGLNYNTFEMGVHQVIEPLPYHYFELWAAVPPLVINHNPIWSLLLISHPILLTVCFFGLYSLVAIFVNKNSERAILSLFLFFIGGLQFEFMHHFLARNFTGFITDAALFTQFGKKFGIIFMALLYAVNQLIQKDEKSFLLSITLAAFFYPTIIPGIGLFLAGIFLLKLKKNKKADSLLISLMGLLLFVPVFYLITKNISLQYNTSFEHLLGSNKLEFRYGVGAWFIYIFLLCFAIYIPILLISIKESLKKYRPLVALTFLMLVSGFFVSIIVPLQRDQIQFFSNAIPLFIIFLQLSFLIAIEKKRLFSVSFFDTDFFICVLQ